MRLRPRSRASYAVLVVVALLWPSQRTEAGPEEDPNPLPNVVACLGGSIGVGQSDPTRGCFRKQGAYWFFAVEPHPHGQLSEVVYRFDIGTGVMESRALAGLPEKVRAAWESAAGDPEAWGTQPVRPWQPRELSFTHGGRRFEIEARAILVQQWFDFRLHPVPWPTWENVTTWMHELGWDDHSYIRELPRPPASALGPYLKFGGHLYFGLAGGFSEGVGGFGGLAIFDLEEESWDVLRPELLLPYAVTDIVTDPGRQTLWLGTVAFGEYGPYPASGLVRFGLRERTWRAYTPENSDLPGGMVWWLRWSPGGLWVSTEKGLGRMSFEDGTWTNFLWSASDSDDSGPRFQLVGTAPPRPAPEATVKTIRLPKGVVGPGGVAEPGTFDIRWPPAE